MFVEIVDKLLLEFQKSLGTKTSVPWSWLFTKLVTLLSRYPTGVTKAILLSELEAAWKKIEKFHSKGTLHGTDSLRSIILTKQLSPQAVFEVFLEKVTFVEGTRTRIGVMKDVEEFESGRFTMEMYLHQKLYDKVDEIMAHNYKLRFTGCRLFEGRSGHSLKLLPSENFVVLIDVDSTERLCKSFSTLEGFHEISESQYINGIKVKVADIGKPEFFHYQNGQTVNKTTVVVVDDLGIQAKFLLWEEYLVLSKLFDEGDILFIKDCFLVPDQNECYTLEYGPDTVIFCYPVAHEQQLVSSQSSSSKHLYVSKDNRGNLDYSVYPEQLTICDVQPGMINLTLFGQVVYVGPKRLLKGEGISKVAFEIKVQDDSGICTVLIIDKFKGGTLVYCGQFVLMQNLVSSDSNVSITLHLNYENAGKLWNISALEGWLTTPSICPVTAVSPLTRNCEHCVLKGITSDLKARDGAATVRVHCSCNTKIEENLEEQVVCGKCDSFGMVELPVRNVSKLFNLDQFWCWQYELSLTIMGSEEHQIQVSITNEVAEKLLQLPAHKFTSLGKDGRRRVLECTLGQECFCGISNFNGEYLVGAISLL